MKKTAVLLLLAFAVILCGKEIFVDYSCKVNGDGSNRHPFRNFASAVKTAGPGDCIKILPVDFVIADSIVIKNFAGDKNNPLTVDGSFNTFTGVEPASGKAWIQQSPGLWKRQLRTSRGLAGRYFLVIDNHIERMGRFFKAKGAAKYKKIEDLAVNQWTMTVEPGSVKGNTLLYNIYLKLDPSCKSPADAGVLEPQHRRTNGVDLSGKSSGIIIKNIICRNFWNDGFNIHNRVTSTLFDTVCAIDCGDDGISAHEKCEISVRNFLSYGNSTGICHVNQAVCSHTNVYIDSALGREIYLKGVAENMTDCRFFNVYVKTSSAGGVTLGAGAGKITVDNMTIVFSKDAGSFDHPAFKGGKSSISRLYILRREPEKMLKFREGLLAKFQGKVEKQLQSR